MRDAQIERLAARAREAGRSAKDPRAASLLISDFPQVLSLLQSTTQELERVREALKEIARTADCYNRPKYEYRGQIEGMARAFGSIADKARAILSPTEQERGK
jgi:hypothetical protein